MTRMLGLEVPYYLGHEGKKFSVVRVNQTFLNLSNYVLQIFFWWSFFACLVNT